MNVGLSTEEINALEPKRLVWNSNISRRAQEFKDLIEDDDIFNRYFGEPYLQKLKDKRSSQISLQVKLAVFYTFLMFSLFATQNYSVSGFSFLGFNFNNLGGVKEYLLIVASGVSAYSVIVSAYNNYLEALIKACVSKMSNNQSGVREFYKHAWEFIPGDALVKKDSHNENIFTHRFYRILVGIIQTVTILLLALMLLGSFLIQLFVVYDVIMNPNFSGFFHYFAISISLLSIVFTMLVSITQMPMPENDYSDLDKLKELEKTNPEVYKEAIVNISKRNSSKVAKSNITLFSCIYIVLFSAFSYFLIDGYSEPFSSLISNALVGAFLVLFFSNELLYTLRNLRLKKAISRDKNDEDGNLNYLKIWNEFENARLLIPAILTLLMVHYIYIYS